MCTPAMIELTLSPRAPRAPSVRLRLRVARGLEEGEWDGPVARLLARTWGVIGACALARPLVWREGLHVVAIGGSTLGGSGKTPLAIACARALAASGARVAFVGHGYRAQTARARVVRADDDVDEVGDEAIVAARALAGIAHVVVAPRRQEALSHATTFADIVVLDGVLQTAPARATLSLLALDAESPWGAGEVVPCGDLRAPKGALLAACDHAVLLRDEASPAPNEPSPSLSAHVRARGAFILDELVPWQTLAPLRLGLFLALARPGRLLGSLARRGVFPHRIVQVPDHGVASGAHRPLSLRSLPPVDLWLASPKCALHLARAKIPHAILEHDVELGAELLERLRRRSPPVFALPAIAAVRSPAAAPPTSAATLAP
jgi:tetraacyldisaccharide 4'-kinase